MLDEMARSREIELEELKLFSAIELEAISQELHELQLNSTDENRKNHTYEMSIMKMEDERVISS